MSMRNLRGPKPDPNSLSQNPQYRAAIRGEFGALVAAISASRGLRKHEVIETALIHFATEAEVEAAGLIE